MEATEVKFCTCGWAGIPTVKHSYEPYRDDGRLLHVKSYHCVNCKVEIASESRLINQSGISKEDLGIKILPLPHSFKGKKYKLTVNQDDFKIYSFDMSNPSRSSHIFLSTNRIECVGEVFYEIIINPSVGITNTGSTFNIEYRISDTEIDTFCEYYLKHFDEKRNRPHLPLPVPNTIPVPSYPPPGAPWIGPNGVPFDPNQLPYSPPTRPKRKWTDPYADADDEKRNKEAEEIIRKWINDIGKQKTKDDEDNNNGWNPIT